MRSSSVRSVQVTIHEPLISAQNLTCRAGETVLLEQVSLEIFPSERIAVVGRSGAGKTTLLRALVGVNVVAPTSLVLFGAPTSGLRNRELRTLRKQTGHISQGFDLVPDLSALENVLVGDFTSGFLPRVFAPLHSVSSKTKALSLLKRFGLSSKASQILGSLSGGERQRVAIMRALISDPKIIFADEPVSALDEETGRLVMSDLADVAESGVAVVAALHQLELAHKWATRILAVSGGRLILDASPSTVSLRKLKSLVSTS